MTIRREDLAAAAAVGLLQYRPIDPLLVFLLQRDVRARRQVLAAQVRGQQRGWAFGLLSLLAIVLAIVTIAMFGLLFSTRAEPAGLGMLFSFAALYVLVALSVVNWASRRSQGGPVRTLSALAVASVPLAVFTLAQFA
jgi:hypothetical protein